jgi:diguanylate cyclase (GGDEF)-like protein
MNLWGMLTHMGKDDVLNKFAEDLSAAVPAYTILVLTRDPQTGSYHVSAEDQRNKGPRQYFLDGTDPVIRRLLAGEAWVQWTNPDCSAIDAEVATAFIFPIAMQGLIDRAIVVSGGNLSESDIRLIGGYCRQTALALETIDMQASVKRKIERLASLVGMSDDLSGGQSYRNLLQTVLRRSAELLLAEQSSIMLIEKETDVLLLEASRGVLNEPAQRIRIPKGFGIAGKVAEMGEPILVENIENDLRIGKKNQAKYKTSSFVSVPLKIGSRVVGVMNFTDKATGELFDDVDLQFAQTCASHAAFVLDHREMSEETEKLKQQATTDHLTGLLNRGRIMSRLREELSRSDRYTKAMSLVMLDLDGFKNINDHFGHGAGDRVLRIMSEVMMKAVRSIDIVGRYGGDEFIIILPETDTYFAAYTAERVRADIAKTNISLEISDRIVNTITASIGIASFPQHGRSMEVLMEHVDEALYRAKAGGRNRVVVY